MTQLRWDKIINVGCSLAIPLPFATQPKGMLQLPHQFPYSFSSYKIRILFCWEWGEVNLQTKVIQKREGEERQRKENAVLKGVMGNCEMKCSGLAGRQCEVERQKAHGVLVNAALVFEFVSPLWLSRNISKGFELFWNYFWLWDAISWLTATLLWDQTVCSRSVKVTQADE